MTDLEEEFVPTSSRPVCIQLARDLGDLAGQGALHNIVSTLQPYLDVHCPAE